MKNANLVTLIGFCVFVIFFSCKHEPLDQGTRPDPNGTGNGGTGSGSGQTGSGGSSVNTCDPNKVYFQQQVLPVLIANCTTSGCHNKASHQKGIVLTSYEKVLSTTEIKPGDPAESKIYKMITHTDVRKRMPKDRPPLAADQIKLIYDWIKQGAKNETCNAGTCTTGNVTYTNTVKNILANNCTGCHSGSTSASGLDLSQYSIVKAKVDDGRLWGAINHLPGYAKMPKSNPQVKLSDCELKQIEKWISAGAPNN